MLFLALDSGREKLNELVRETQPAAVAHHGGVTDVKFAQGKAQRSTTTSRRYTIWDCWPACRPTIPTTSSASPTRAGKSTTS